MLNSTSNTSKIRYDGIQNLMELLVLSLLFMKKVVRLIKKIQDETSDYSRKNKLPYAAHTLTYNTVEDQVLNQNPNLNSLPSHQCFQSINQVSLIITYIAVKTEIF
ncbi:unnamed protein product [Rhizophagus irregularis]|nr:unnamed protein product [Rhizophagus irregularis]